MMRATLFSIALLLPCSALAEGVSMHQSYLRASGPTAKAAAAFMMIHNDTENDVTLIGAQTDVARKVELHTHVMENDVAKMREIEGGITIPAGGHHELKRGADHVMLMGLTGTLEQGAMVPITFLFKSIPPMTLEIEVDNERGQEDGHDHKEGHKDGHKDHSNH